MENHIENIDLIDRYLNKSLSEKEIKDIEKRLLEDDGFKELLESHSLLLQGIKRSSLKTEIKNAKRLYFRNKWLRYFGGISIILGLIISGFIYMNLNNHQKQDTTPIKIDKPETIVDSSLSKDFEVVLKEEVVLNDSTKLENNELKKHQKPEVKPLVANVEIPKRLSEKFTIATNKDTTIICKDGTELKLKANSFIDQNSKGVTRNMDFYVTEYYKISDILLANLSTKSNGKQLETGGMLHIQATKGDENLKLKPNSPIEILFPTKGKKDSMQLFTGEWKNGNINWELHASKELLLEKDIEEVVVFEEAIDVPFSVVEEVPVYPGCENLNREATRKCTSEAISKFVQKKFNTQIADDLGLVGRQRINVIFKIDEIGGIVNIRSRGPEPELEMEAIRVIASLPKILPGKQRGKVVSVPYSIPIIFQANGSTITGRPVRNKRIRDSIYTRRIEDRITGKDSVKANVSQVYSYILRTSELGWINCDRFIKARRSLNYKIKIKDGKGIIRVNMVFKSLNSVLPSRRSGEVFDFGLVPVDKDVMLVAIKQDEGKIYLDIIEAKTKENPNIEFNFKEMTLETLRGELKKLNK